MITVTDAILPADLFRSLSTLLRQGSYSFGWHSTATDPINYWNTQFYDRNSGDFSEDIVAQVWRHLESEYPEHILQRAYSNAMTVGIPGSIHRDSPESGDLTVLIYTVQRWKAEWAGETVFFDESREIIKAVLPKPNRVVVFDSNILHVARGIYPHCSDLRTILVFKLLKRR